MKKQTRLYRNMFIAPVVAVLTLGTVAAGPTMASTNSASASVSTSVTVDEAVGSGGNQMEPQFKTWGKNNRLSCGTVTFATGKGGAGTKYYVSPGGGTPKKIDSAYVPPMSVMYIDGWPVFGGRTGYWHNNGSLKVATKDVFLFQSPLTCR